MIFCEDCFKTYSNVRATPTRANSTGQGRQWYVRLVKKKKNYSINILHAFRHLHDALSAMIKKREINLISTFSRTHQHASLCRILKLI